MFLQPIVSPAGALHLEWASSAQEGELPWTSYASGDSPSCRTGKLQETFSAVSLLSPFLPISQSDAV